MPKLYSQTYLVLELATEQCFPISSLRNKSMIVKLCQDNLDHKLYLFINILPNECQETSLNNITVASKGCDKSCKWQPEDAAFSYLEKCIIWVIGL